MEIGIHSYRNLVNSPNTSFKNPAGSKYSPESNNSSQSPDQEVPNSHQTNPDLAPTRQFITIHDYKTDLYRLINMYRDMMINQSFGGFIGQFVKTKETLKSTNNIVPEDNLPPKIPNTGSTFSNISDEVTVVYSLHPCLVGPQLECLDYLLKKPTLWTSSTPLAQLSSKLFLGGVPIHNNCVTLQTQNSLVRSLSRYGPMKILWPREINVVPELGLSVAMKNLTLTRTDSKRGHCYAIFENPASIFLLLSNCHRRPKGFYINLNDPSLNMTQVKLDSIQVIPWNQNDGEYPTSQELMNNSMKSPKQKQLFKPKLKKYSVFVGALHGMFTSRALYTIFNDLFGNVHQAALDMDKYKYPIGSGRVTFTSPQSYLNAVKTNFIRVECPFFKKVIQIDPYLEDAICSKCLTALGVYFCRQMECFDYFCPECWPIYHENNTSQRNHKPLKRTINPKSVYDAT